ncbi:MAG: hypothetical protein JO142_21660 [Burkholderiales bacterium]|nr:hypothetical protein [Burkholderiales bacterium]
MASRLNDVGMICLAGAFGGSASLVYLYVQGKDPLIPIWPMGFPAYAFLGSLAALLSVYFVANTNTQQIKRALAFSAACGFAWQPVLEASNALIQKSVQSKYEKKVATENVSAAHEIKELSTLHKDRLEVAANNAVAHVLDLVKEGNQVHDSKLRQDINVTALALMSELTKIKEENIRENLVLPSKKEYAGYRITVADSNQMHINSLINSLSNEIRVQTGIVPKVPTTIGEAGPSVGNIPHLGLD